MPVEIPLPISKGGTSATGVSGILSGLGLTNLVFTTGTQTISGEKTFSDSLFGLSGLEIGPSEISPTLYIKGKRVSINQGSDPQYNLHVSGSSFFNERPLVNGSGVLLSGEGKDSIIRGQISKMDAGVITISNVGTYVSTQLIGVFDSSSSNGMSIGTSNNFAIKNTSNSTRVVKIYASMDSSAGSNETLGIKLAKNGTPIDESECRANTSNSSFAKLVTNWMVTMAQNDEVSLFVANHSSTNNINFQRGRIVASSVN
jgi:hypothetical protein